MPQLEKAGTWCFELDFSVEADMLGAMSEMLVAFGLIYRGRLLIGC